MIRAAACIGLVVLLSGAAFRQSTGKPPAFDVADVHVVAPSPLGAMAGGILRGGRYELRDATMVDLIKTAYSVDDDKVLGGPGWLELDRFDVIAKAPASATPEAAKVMLQNLLADRFKLTVHKDNKPLPVYVLSPGKGSPKMKEADGSHAAGCQLLPPSPPVPGVIQLAVVSCHNITMAAFAEQLHQIAVSYVGDHPVVDSTNLEGSWDFDIKATPGAQLAAAGADAISIFDAVDKQLGLKLQLQEVPMPVIVVDNVSRKPTDNLPGVGKSLPDAPVEFEVADIKPDAPGSQGRMIRYTPGGRIEVKGSLKEIITMALDIPFNISSDILVGAPKSLDSERFDIVAKTPSAGIGAVTVSGGREMAPPIGVAVMMLRALVMDRFKLAIHTEDQQATVYTIIPPKGEPKLQKADESERAGCKPARNAAPVIANAGPTIAFKCQNTTIAELAFNVQQWAGGYIDHPVVDTTGLQGGWDFVLSWTPRGALDNPNRPADAAGGLSAADPGGLSVFEALDKELGLKLVAQKHTIPVIVVDHVEEKPTGN